ncbi:MAG: hypothetical protein RR846_07695 [Oscillospiraceae bacterium]
MRGLKHNVIEINDTDNANIERILVFLTPQAEKVSVMTTRQEASRLLKQLDIKKIKAKPKFNLKFLLFCLGCAAAAILLLIIL